MLWCEEKKHVNVCGVKKKKQSIDEKESFQHGSLSDQYDCMINTDLTFTMAKDNNTISLVTSKLHPNQIIYSSLHYLWPTSSQDRS
mgnify:CR=1 FL=1